MSETKSFLLIEGATVPVYAPLHSDGSLNLDYILPYGNTLITRGIKNIFINGTTGEFFSLSVAERKAVLETWHNSHVNNFGFIVHVGTSSLPETVELTQHAAELGGVKAIAVVPPYFVPPSGVDALVRYFQGVARVAGGLPILFYHIPSLSHCNVPLEHFLEVALEKVPGFCGMKFTDNDLPLMETCQKRFGDKMQILCGQEAIYLEAIHMGIREGIFASFNFYPSPYQHLRNYALSISNGTQTESGVKPDEEKSIILNFFKACEPFATKNGMIPLLKDLGRLSGFQDAGPSRLPLTNLSKDELDELLLKLSAVCPEFLP